LATTQNVRSPSGQERTIGNTVAARTVFINHKPVRDGRLKKKRRIEPNEEPVAGPSNLLYLPAQNGQHVQGRSQQNPIELENSDEDMIAVPIHSDSNDNDELNFLSRHNPGYMTDRFAVPSGFRYADEEEAFRPARSPTGSNKRPPENPFANPIRDTISEDPEAQEVIDVDAHAPMTSLTRGRSIETSLPPEGNVQRLKMRFDKLENCQGLLDSKYFPRPKRREKVTDRMKQKGEVSFPTKNQCCCISSDLLETTPFGSGADQRHHSKIFWKAR
jgi:hypothetical protein